jgi:hypothetical protein
VSTLIAETMRWHPEAATLEFGVWLPTTGKGSAPFFRCFFPSRRLRSSA